MHLHSWTTTSSYCFFSNSDADLVENATDNIQGKKQFAKFRMLQIEEGKHFYYIYTLVTLTFQTEVILIPRWWIQIMIIYSWSCTRHCWRDFVSTITDFE